MDSKIRHQFFTYRNGVVADTLKGAGDPHELIFGLQLPQLSRIARERGDGLCAEERKALAEELWSERNCRESRLLAPFFFDAKAMTRTEAEALLDDCRTHEETDILVFRSLRYHPEAREIAQSRSGSYDSEALSRFF